MRTKEQVAKIVQNMKDAEEAPVLRKRVKKLLRQRRKLYNYATNLLENWRSEVKSEFEGTQRFEKVEKECEELLSKLLQCLDNF